ncbi:hypothetical protein TNCV_4183001 [Trichonephila clavipes]|nr:hypothetical protein TNCV_4183001 [Trichonephila clavipes]
MQTATNQAAEENSAGLDCPTAFSKKFISVDDDNVCSHYYGKNISEFVQSSKNTLDADSEDENEMSEAIPVPMSSEWRNIMKSIRSYLDAHSNSQMNNKIDDIK